jgi:hypothetical protein
MRSFAVLLSGVAVVVLAASVGVVLPAETLALSAGVLVGALTAVPMSLLFGALLPAPLATGAQSAAMPEADHPPYPRVDGYSPVMDYPPVVIVNPAAFQNRRRDLPPGESTGLPVLEAQRQFHLIGEASQP